MWVIFTNDIADHARAFGLDFYPTLFEVLSYDRMNEVAAYGGFPTRYPHWRFGMEYERISRSHEYGLSKIYELVINNDPTYAYLVRSNSLLEQKLVMAHVYGHADFFKHNLWFAGTNRKMMDQMPNHGTPVRKLIDRYGPERFIEGTGGRLISEDETGQLWQTSPTQGSPNPVASQQVALQSGPSAALNNPGSRTCPFKEPLPDGGPVRSTTRQ